MNNSKLTQEQKDFLLAVMWRDTKEFCEAVVEGNTCKVIEHLIKTCNDNCTTTFEATFLMRYGNTQMKKKFIDEFIPSLTLLKDAIGLETDEEIMTQLAVKYITSGKQLPLNLLNGFLDKCDTLVFVPNLSKRTVCTNNVNDIITVLNERNIPLELAVFYLHHEPLTPANFWDNDEIIDAIVEYPEMYQIAPQAALVKILSHPKFVSKLSDNIFSFKNINVDIVILIFSQKVYSIQNIQQITKKYEFRNKDLEKLYDYNIELFNAVVDVMSCSWSTLFSHPIRNEVLEIIANKRLSFDCIRCYDSIIMRCKNAKTILNIIDEKKLWSIDLIHRVFHSNHYDLMLKLMKTWNKGDYEISILEEFVLSSENFECIHYLLDNFGIQDSNNEKYLGKIKLKETREKLLCFYNEKYGFRSHEGKEIWKEYCIEHNRIGWWQKIKQCFG